MRDSYISEIDKLTIGIGKINQKYNNCRSDFNVSQETIVHLSQIKGTCLDKLNHVSETIELLSSAFMSKHNMSQKLYVKLEDSRKNVKNLTNILSSKEISASQLKLENET